MANYGVMHDDDGWKAQRDGAGKASGRFDTQAEAQARANELARNSGGGEVRLHRKDNNQIRDTNTIGKKDPYPPRG